MKKYLPLLKNCALFANIADAQLETLLSCLSARVRDCPRQTTVFLAGDTVSDIYIVLSGKIQILQEDFSGNRTILTEVGPGDLFGEAFACAGLPQCPVTALAAAESQVMHIPFVRLLTGCTTACGFHTTLIQNMLRILAWKNIALNSKNEILGKRSTREKLMAYFAQQVRRQGSTSFTVPYGRSALADFLCVDRSAMSRELGNMRREGLLEFERNQFRILRVELLEEQG